MSSAILTVNMHQLDTVQLSVSTDRLHTTVTI